MKTFEQDIKDNPTFNTVTGLSNITFDPETVVSNRGATEGQVKYVYDRIAELQAWLDENGCSDDPFNLIRQKVTELEEAIGICCANPQDSVVQTLNDRMAAIETALDECNQVIDDGAYQGLVTRLNNLQTSFEECCANYNAKVEQLISSLVVVGNESTGEETRVVGTNCNENDLTLSYAQFDFSNVNEYLQTRTSFGVKIGKINYTFNVTGKKVYNVGFFAKTVNNTYYSYHGSDKVLLKNFRLEGYENLLIFVRNRSYVASWNETFGDIYLEHSGSGYRNGEFPQGEDYSCGGTLVVGPNKTYKKIFAALIDTNGCTWEVEIPLSELNLAVSGVDYSIVDGVNYDCPDDYLIHVI